MVRGSWVVCLGIALASAWTVPAQTPTTGSLSGCVVDAENNAVDGAEVVVHSPRGSLSVSTDETGRFLLPYLTPDRYTVRVEKPGFRTVERLAVDVHLERRSEVVITLAKAVFADTVEASAAPPLLDRISAGVGRTLESEELERLPVGRRLSETLYLAPSVSSSGGAGRANPSMSGASGLENQYLVDGVEVSGARYGGLGVYSSEYGSLGTAVTSDFVDEVRVRTAGAEATDEYSTGGLVSVVTRGGTNEFAGSVFGYATPAGLEGDRNRLSLADGAVNTVSAASREVGFTVGGPIVRDRLFYFLAASQRFEQATFLAPDGFPLTDLGEVDRERTALAYATKVTWQPGAEHRLETTTFGDPTDGDTGPQSSEVMRFRDTSAFSGLDFGGDNQGLSYQGVLSSSWLVEASISRAATRFQETTQVDEWQVTDETVTPAGVSGGKGRYESRNDGESLQLRLGSTHLTGRHEIQYGLSAEEVTTEVVRNITGPPIVLSNGQTTRGGALVTVLPDPVYGQIYRVTRASLSSLRWAQSTNVALYAQDRITVGRDVTVSAGLRYERQHMEGMAAEFTFDDNWSPRVSATWDVGGRGRTRLQAGFGVLIAKMPNQPASGMFRTGARVLRADYFDPALTDPVPEGVEALGTTRHLLLSNTEVSTVDPSSELTRTRELSISLEHAVRDDLVLGLHYQHRDMPTVLEDVNTSAMVLYYLDDDTVEYLLTNPRDGYPETAEGIGAFVDPVRDYDAVILTAEKRLSDNWSLFASYRWSRLWGNYEGFYRNDYEQSNPARTGVFDFPTNDPSYTEIGVPEYGFSGDIRYQGESGLLPNDRTHQVKVYGSWVADGGLVLGAGVFAGSGRPLTPMAASPVYDRPGEIPEAPRGSGIQTEDGFADRTPAEWSVDLHAGYTFPLAGGEVELLLDVFNVFDHQGVLTYDQNTEVGFGVPNPDFGRRTSYQPPRTIRLGVRFEM